MITLEIGQAEALIEELDIWETRESVLPHEVIQFADGTIVIDWGLTISCHPIRDPSWEHWK